MGAPFAPIAAITASTRRSGAAALLILLAACTEGRREVGEECLKDDDCRSALCSDSVCAPTPPRIGAAGSAPLLDDPRIAEGGAGADAGTANDAGDGGAR